MTFPGSSPRLLYFSPAASGGLADYARAQANALAALGLEVDVLSSAAFPMLSDDAFTLRPDLRKRPHHRSRFLGRLAGAGTLWQHFHDLASLVRREKYRHVLLGSYAEYLAPLWAGPLQRLAQDGVIFGAVVHDPVRDFVVGPTWWHHRSIAAGYSFLREAFVHETVALETFQSPPPRTTVVPHGPYAFPPAIASNSEVRRRWEIPDNAEIWLSFGHIRDGKNLDLIIRALVEFPDAFLLVAGREQSGGQKPIAFYQKLARQCGVSERCRWLNRFIPSEEVGDLFVASDLVMLTYSQNFRSASGVLNAAVHFRKPSLVSSGQGNLCTTVRGYGLGLWIEPDDFQALLDGIRRWRLQSPQPQWDAYAAVNSWSRNAELVHSRLFEAFP